VHATLQSLVPCDLAVNELPDLDLQRLMRSAFAHFGRNVRDGELGRFALDEDPANSGVFDLRVA
jgi:hypothetical protein